MSGTGKQLQCNCSYSVSPLFLPLLLYTLSILNTTLCIYYSAPSINTSPPLVVSPFLSSFSTSLGDTNPPCFYTFNCSSQWLCLNWGTWAQWATQLPPPVRFAEEAALPDVASQSIMKNIISLPRALNVCCSRLSASGDISVQFSLIDLFRIIQGLSDKESKVPILALLLNSVFWEFVIDLFIQYLFLDF